MIIVCLLLCLLLLLSFLVYASYSIQSGIYLRSFCKKHTAEKIVALTFDDGPDSLQTPKVLQVLKEYQVTACFFCCLFPDESFDSLYFSQRMLSGFPT